MTTPRRRSRRQEAPRDDAPATQATAATIAAPIPDETPTNGAAKPARRRVASKVAANGAGGDIPPASDAAPQASADPATTGRARPARRARASSAAPEAIPAANAAEHALAGAPAPSGDDQPGSR